MKITNDNAKELRNDFPIFKRKINGKPLIYLDNAATTQKPQRVLDAIQRFYEQHNANIHRGVYQLSEEATEQYGRAHAVVGKFLGANANEIIFTRNTTESLNLLAYTVHAIMPKRKHIVLTELEHHSNLVPWQQFAKRHNMSIVFIPMKKDFTLDYDAAEKLIGGDTAILSVGHVSNALGSINDVKKLVSMGKNAGAITIVDGAQGAAHVPVNVKDINCDFYACSAHKLFGPTGIGALYGRKELLENLPPFLFGGDMIKTVSYQDATWNDVPMKFEAGTGAIADAIGFAEAIAFIQTIGLENIAAWERELTQYALKKLRLPGITLLHGHDSAGIISFICEEIHAHDVASLVSDDGVCIRGGHHCAMPLMGKLGIPGTCRISFSVYNSFEDIDQLISSLAKIQHMFKEGGKT